MDTIKYKEALGVIEKIYEWQHYVTKERFFDTARTKYCMESMRSIDELYSLFQLSPNVSMISRNDEHFDEKIENASNLFSGSLPLFFPRRFLSFPFCTWIPWSCPCLQPSSGRSPLSASVPHPRQLRCG